MTPRPATLLKSTAAAGLAAATVAGVPILLVHGVGWPLPTQLPTHGDVAAGLRTGLASTTVIKTLAVVVWIAWSQFALAFAAETLAVVRHRPVRSPTVSRARHAAAQLIGTILLVATTTTVARPALALQPVAATAVDQPHDPPAPATRDVATAGDVPIRLVTVAPRDSWWRLAETHLGDGLRWRQLRDLNRGRTVADGTTITAATDVIHPGWQLAIPTGHSDQPNERDNGSTWTVQRGDNLWDIAQDTLASTNGHQPHDRQTAAYWHELIDLNRQRLVDPARPDHILPGQQLLLPTAAPTIGDATPGPEPDNPDAANPATDTSVGPPTAPVTRTGPDSRRRAAEAATPRQDAASPEGTATQAPDQTNADARRTERASSGPAGHAAPEADEEAPWLLPPTLAATALISAGVLQTLRRRRRAAYAARRAGMRFPTPHPGQQEAAEARLTAAATPDAVLDDLWSLLRTIPEHAQPALVRMRDDRVTLTFDQPPGDPPPPWTQLSDNGAGEWTTASHESGPVRSVGLPLTVTLGHTEPGDLLLANLATCGPLTVTGDPADVRTRLRTMALEVATTTLAHTPQVLILGDDLLAHLEHVRHVDDPAPAVADCVTAVACGIHPEDRTPLLLVCHDDRDLQLPACTDLALIRANTDPDPGDDATLLELDGPDRGVLQLTDGTRHPLHLPAVDPEIVDDALVALDHPVLHLDEHLEEPTGPTDTNDGPPHRLGERAVEATWCQVRLLGPVDVLIDGQAVEDLPPKPLELLLYLATHRDSATTERVTDALWPGIPPRSAAERARKNLTRLRAALGNGPDGEPLVPHRTRGGDGRILLSPHLSTDLDHALGLLDAARRSPDHKHLDLTLSALDQVRGQPLETMPMSWASEITQRAIIELQDGAEHAARLAITHQRHDDAVHVLRSAIRLLPSTEMLYLSLATVEADRGRPELVSDVRQEFETAADDLEFEASSVLWDRLQSRSSAATP